MQAWSGYGLLWTVVNDLLGLTPMPRPANSVAKFPRSRPPRAVDGREPTSRRARWPRPPAVTAPPTGPSDRREGLALTIGRSWRRRDGALGPLNGAPGAYQLVATNRGTAVEVSVPHPAADEVLAVQA